MCIRDRLAISHQNSMPAIAPSLQQSEGPRAVPDLPLDRLKPLAYPCGAALAVRRRATTPCHHTRDGSPAHAAIEAEHEQGAIGLPQLISNRRNAVLDLGAQVQRRATADTRDDLGDPDDADPPARVRRPPQAKRGVAGEGVEPRLDRGAMI